MADAVLWLSTEGLTLLPEWCQNMYVLIFFFLHFSLKRYFPFKLVQSFQPDKSWSESTQLIILQFWSPDDLSVYLKQINKNTLGLNPSLRSFCMEFECSACDCVGSHSFLTQSKIMIVRLLWLSKLSLGMSACTWMFVLCVSVRPYKGQAIQCAPCLSPAGDNHQQQPCKNKRRIYNRWMDKRN